MILRVKVLAEEEALEDGVMSSADLWLQTISDNTIQPNQKQ